MKQTSDQNNGKITHWCYSTTKVTARLTDVEKNMHGLIDNKQSTIKKTKKASMLANPDIKRWFENLARGSRNTAEVKLRRLNVFCQMH